MKYQNKDNMAYKLHIFLNKDCDVFSYFYFIDNKKMSLTLSNKGWYSIYLGHFQTLILEDKDYLLFELHKEVEVDNELTLTNTLGVCDYEDIASGLNLEDGRDLLKAFNRLRAMTNLFLETLDDSLLIRIKNGLSFLVENYYSGSSNYSGNWWNYEIGIPRCINEVLWNLFDKLDKQFIHTCLNIENFYLPTAKYIFYRRNYPNIYREEANYANLADNIYICLLRAIMLQQSKFIEELFVLLPNVFQKTKKEDGFYLDGSFIQHKNIPYNLSYGEVLLNSVSKCIELFALVGMDSNSLYQQIEEYIFKYYTPFLYNKMALDCLRGRAVSRKKQDAYYSYRTILDAIIKINEFVKSDRIKEFIYLEKQNESDLDITLVCNSMNRYIKRNKDYLIAISANSNYIANYESINGENLLGSYSSNFTYDLFYSKEDYHGYVLSINPYYRNGSTNSFEKELENELVNNLISTGVTMDGILNCCYHQNNQVKGLFSKIVLPNSMVCVGSKICSDLEYVTTIHQSDKAYEKEDEVYKTNKTKIRCKQDVQVLKFNESRSYFELNENETNDLVDFIKERLILNNPKEYEYQISFDGKMDAYEYLDFKDVHYIKYDNMVLLNSFSFDAKEIDLIQFKGYFSAIIKIEKENVFIHIASGSREPRYVEIGMNGYIFIETNLQRKGNGYIFEDENSHFIHLRKEE